MSAPPSRYDADRPFEPSGAAGEGGAFPGRRPRRITTPPGVLEHTLAAGERPDLLAHHYYDDDRRWWRILDANPELLYAGDLGAGDLASGVGAGERVIVIPRGEE